MCPQTWNCWDPEFNCYSLKDGFRWCWMTRKALSCKHTDAFCQFEGDEFNTSSLFGTNTGDIPAPTRTVWLTGEGHGTHEATKMSAQTINKISIQPPPPLPAPLTDSKRPHKADSLISTKCHDILNAQSLRYCFYVQPRAGGVAVNGFYTNTQRQRCMLALDLKITKDSKELGLYLLSMSESLKGITL